MTNSLNIEVRGVTFHKFSQSYFESLLYSHLYVPAILEDETKQSWIILYLYMMTCDRVFFSSLFLIKERFVKSKRKKYLEKTVSVC